MNGRGVAIGAGLLGAAIAAAVLWGVRGTTSPTPTEPASARATAPTPPPVLEGAGAGPARLPADVIAGSSSIEASKPARRAPIGVTSGAVAVSGRAVDERGAALASPSFEVVVPEGLLIDGRGEADGRFVGRVPLLHGEGSLVGVLTVSVADGRLARREVRIRGDWRTGGYGWRTEEALGDVVLRAPRDVAVLVTAADGRPVAADVAALPAGTASATPRATCRTGADGRGTLAGLTPEAHVLVAWASGFGRARRELPAEGAPSPVALTLPLERTLAVRVIEDAGETPVAGARVEILAVDSGGGGGVTVAEAYVPAAEGTLTDEDGRVTLRGLAPDEALWIVAVKKGLALAGARADHVTVPVEAAEVTVRLARTRTIAWPVKDGERPAPAEGSVIGIRTPAGSRQFGLPSEGRMEGGELVVEGCPAAQVKLIAVAPDGSTATAWAAEGQAIGAPISFRPARRVVVVLRYADGAPASGLPIEFRQEGNNPVGSATTDAEGRAVLEGQEGHRRTAFLKDELTGPMGLPLGDAVISNGDGLIEFTIERPRTVTVVLRSGGAPVDPARVRLVIAGGWFYGLKGDPQTGEVEVRWRPPDAEGPWEIHADGGGYLQADASIPAGDPSPRVTLEMRPAGAIALRLTLAPDGSQSATLQRYDAERGRWVSLTAEGIGGLLPFSLDRASGRAKVGGLEAGRYRWVDAQSGTVGAAFDLAPGATSAEMSLDLSKVVTVEGRVEVPSGVDPRNITIERVGEDRDVPSGPINMGFGVGAPVSNVWTDENGRFRMRVPGATPVRLRVAGPWLAPAPQGGTVEVTGARKDLVLKCVRTPKAWVRFDRELRVNVNPGSPRSEVVRLYRGEPVGEPAYETAGLVEGDRVSFAGFEPGRYTVWIDATPFAPTVVRAVDLGPGETDLGQVPVNVGSTIVVKVLLKPGASIPGLVVHASPPGKPPPYSRFTQSFGGQEPRLTGLGAGTFEVYLSGHGVRFRPRTITLDGTSEVPLELDLRK